MNFGEKSIGNKKTDINHLQDYFNKLLAWQDHSKENSFSEPKTQKVKISKAFWSSTYSNERCDRTKLLLQEKQAGIDSIIITEETVTVADKLLEYKCKSTKEHRVSIIDCLN